MAELEPCKYCGGKGEHIKLYDSKRYDCFIKCTSCEYETQTYTSKQNAVKAWNRRGNDGRM